MKCLKRPRNERCTPYRSIPQQVGMGLIHRERILEPEPEPHSGIQQAKLMR